STRTVSSPPPRPDRAGRPAVGRFGRVRVVKALRRFTVRAHLPERLAALGELSTNLRWSWHPPTQDLFAGLDPVRWRELGHDPVRMLGEVAPERLDEL